MNIHTCSDSGDGTCRCGVSVANPCDVCGAAGHHLDSCPESEDAMELTYHGHSHPAAPCGTYKGTEVYLLSMATSRAIVKRAAKRPTSANWSKAKAVVLHADTSAGPDAAIIQDIVWEGDVGEAAKAWALAECRQWLKNTARSADYYAERHALTRALLAL